MGSKANKDSDSPSTSTFSLPQLRSSRRGSFASLQSTTQLDKEALSQALDQIHSTASQSDTLTTFNEYTSPPSSSSGTDSKGIASELQGGLSGFYTRLRASVGNVKDIVSHGGDEVVGETRSTKSSNSAIDSPVASTHTVYGTSQLAASGSGVLRATSVSGSGGQSPAVFKPGDHVSSEYAQTLKPALESGIAPSKSTSGSLATTKAPPANLKQAAQPTTIRPALAEITISAIKDLESPTQRASDPKNVGPPHVQGGSGLGEISEAGAPGDYSVSQGPNEHHNAWRQNDVSQSIELLDARDSRSHDSHLSPFPSIVAEKKIDSAIESSSDGDHDNNSEPPRIVSASNKVADDVFDVSTYNSENTTASRQSTYQHLELPLQKDKGTTASTTARSHSANSSLSHVTSLDLNGNSPVTSRHGAAKSPKSVNITDGILYPDIPAGSVPGDPRAMNVFSQVKNKVLTKEYWMKDENAKDCFYCGDTFSTFRRKHHCRTCGQIFDSKCTSLISGNPFGQSGTIRVCKPCESIINGGDDSSEMSDEGNLSVRGSRLRRGSAGAGDVLASPSAPSNQKTARDLHRNSKHPEFTIPTMSIPATRKAGRDSSRKPTVLEIDGDRTLTRPSSSRSLKSSLAKSYHPGHRRHNSRQLLQRGIRSVHEDNAPFHQEVVDDKGRSRRLPAFHDDNIIDPDLAPYLSDEESSEEEQVSLMAAMNGDGLSRSHENERHGFGGLLGSSKKLRSRVGEKSMSAVTFASRDTDSHSVSSQRLGNASRSSKRRNLSVTGNTHLRPSPRSYRGSMATPLFGVNLHESSSNSALAQMPLSTSPGGASRMIRSSSMRGSAAPAVELNNASLRHVRRLLHQLLEDSKVPNVTSWEKSLIPILLRATDDVNPDVQNGDEIDIRHYVKLKKIPGGRPGDTSYVSGLVFTKNLALKGMPRSIAHPNILILTFPLEYARHQLHFMSLEPVIRQEREFLQNIVSRIAALRPQLLLVERHVSGLALEFLQQANIATAYNVKVSVLQAVARCCQTRIISSIDKLAIKPALAGKCESFYLKTYIDRGRKKTYMFVSGCAKELGCTIVLRGDNNAILAKMKRITEFMIYVVYNLKLETCLMRDEFASIPSSMEAAIAALDKTASSQPFQELLSDRDPRITLHGTTQEIGESLLQSPIGFSADRLKSQKPGQDSDDKAVPSLPDEESVPEDIPMPTFYGDMVELHNTKILSASPFVKFAQPYLLVRAREQERRLAHLKRLRDQDVQEQQTMEDKSKAQKFDLIKPEMVHEKVETASRKVREVLQAVHEAEYDKALHNYQTQSKQWETYISGNNNLFDPYAHQNIVVLHSLVCTTTTNPCIGPNIIAFGYYNGGGTEVGFEPDFTLGQYVEELCINAYGVCTENGCERKMHEHHRQYVHGEAQVSIFVEPYPCKLRGLQDTILMWSTCRKCSKETQVLPMSESSWKYSFGKYLELSFWSSELHARAGICPHDLHRDHLRYFGFKDMAIRVHYDPITLVEIIAPRARITWKVDNDLRFKNDLFVRIEDRINKFMLSVKSRIKSIKTESVPPEKVEDCSQEIEKLSKRASEEHSAIIRKLRERYLDSKHYEIIPLNQALRAVQDKVAEWDNAFAEFDQNFLPSEKDIRRLATLQLKKIFLDRDDPNNSPNPAGDGQLTAVSEEPITQDLFPDNTPALTPQTRRMSPEKAHDMLAAVVEKHVSADSQVDHHQSAPATAVPKLEVDDLSTSFRDSEREDVRHLDLAVPSEVHERLRDEQSFALSNSWQPDNPLGIRGIDSESTFGRSITNGDAVPHDGSENAMPANESPKATPVVHTSSIPRPVDSSQRRVGGNVSPTFSRTQSHPTHFRKGSSASSGRQSPLVIHHSTKAENLATRPYNATTSASETVKKPVDRKLADRLGLNPSKPTGVNTHSMIPRSIASRRQDSKVSNLAKHFEQLSREFEKERMRERRQRVAKSRQARAYPMAASKPIIHIYNDVDEAVEEREPSDEDTLSSDHTARPAGDMTTVDHMAETTVSQTSGDGFHAEKTTANSADVEEDRVNGSHVGSDVEGESHKSDEENSILDDIPISGDASEHHALSPEEAQLDLKLDLPKHEKSSLMKMLTNFWAERSASGWQPLEYPLNATDHIFADSDIIVREDEPSSLIALVLDRQDYAEQLRSTAISEEVLSMTDEKSASQSPAQDAEQAEQERSLLRETSKHIKYGFTEGPARMLCKVFFAAQFDALRRKCGVSERIVESLSRCMKWDSKGGKTKSVFLKTLDDRFVLKSLSPVETKAFIDFAPDYFAASARFLFHDMPSVIAKMVGFYQVTIKNQVTGTEFNYSLLVMENLFYGRNPDRTFDLKGSMRNRRIQSTGEQNEVLLDENMVDFIYETPLFAREHSIRVLGKSVYNDTLFLSQQNVMDYSLMMAIETPRRELAVGIIDCIRTFTWDKKLESWIKDRGKNKPTVTSPREYKRRFRQAMRRYVLQVPNCWHQFEVERTENRPRIVDFPREDERDVHDAGV